MRAKGSKNNKTLRMNSNIQQFWANRIGRELGVSKAEMMEVIFGLDAVNSWDEKFYAKKGLELSNAMRWLKNTQKSLRVITAQVMNEHLDDSSLSDEESKFGKRTFTGWLYFQADKVEDVKDYKARLQLIATKLEACGNNQMEQFALHMMHVEQRN